MVILQTDGCPVVYVVVVLVVRVCHVTVAPLQSVAASAQRSCGGSSSIMQALSSMLVHLPLVPAWLCFRCWRK